MNNAAPQPVLDERFQWSPQPRAAAWVAEISRQVRELLPVAETIKDRLLRDAGVRFDDLIDTILLGDASAHLDGAVAAGWVREDDGIYRHLGGVFPPVAVDPGQPPAWLGIDLKVESVEAYLSAWGVSRTIVGEPGMGWRRAGLADQPGVAALGATERLGWRGLRSDDRGRTDPVVVSDVLARFRGRRREFDEDEQTFDHADRLIDDAIARTNRDIACQLYFVAERDYWMSRNRAARVQYARQQRLGIAWANHDHHTYRSSRALFPRLVGIWEKLGLVCRERFYAGREAGWGAQVMEQPVTGIVTFNDVDLSPDELLGDFAHEPLPPRDSLGTVGLWCALHGEAFAQAGMHHLEGQFSFDALREQLAARERVATMKPFTDFPHLRQAFTEGERWPVAPLRIDKLLAAGLITASQAEQFRASGAIGSHLENLERNDGFKGFNQTGVSQIIAATDPRRHLSVP